MLSSVQGLPPGPGGYDRWLPQCPEDETKPGGVRRRAVPQVAASPRGVPRAAAALPALQAVHQWKNREAEEQNAR